MTDAEKQAAKYIYLYVVQQYTTLGWEDVGTHDIADADSYKNARQEILDYRKNMPTYPVRLIARQATA